MRPIHYLLFLLFLASLSAVLLNKNSPGLIGSGFRTLGNLFNSTIEG